MNKNISFLQHSPVINDNFITHCKDTKLTKLNLQLQCVTIIFYIYNLRD